MDEVRQKLKILVAIDEVPDPVWERFQPLARLCFERDGLAAYHALARERFDATFIDLHLTGMDSLELLRRVRREKLCPNLILTSSAPSFAYAQQGILYGVLAYLLRPLQTDEVAEVMHKLQGSAAIPDRGVWEAAKAVAASLREDDISEVFLQTGRGLIRNTADPIEEKLRWRKLYGETVNLAFQLHPWLALYHNIAEYEALDCVQEADGDMVVNFCLRNLEKLNDELLELFPRPRTAKLEEILILLLETVDENIQQKDVAERHYITNSSLSTRFQRNLGMSYRAYMTRVKIRRGQYLLRYTDIASGEVATHLGYKDKEYFARIFVQHTGQTIQECAQKTWGEYNI